jgi:hypothetical protein
MISKLNQHSITTCKLGNSSKIPNKINCEQNFKVVSQTWQAKKFQNESCKHLGIKLDTFKGDMKFKCTSKNNHVNKFKQKLWWKKKKNQNGIHYNFKKKRWCNNKPYM